MHEIFTVPKIHTTMKYPLQNSVVIITGAASGIGRALAINAAQQQAFVIGVDIDAQNLAETVLLVKQKTQQDMASYVVDVGDAQAIIHFADQALPLLQQRYLVLINNAGVSLHSGHFGETALKDFEWLFNINFWGAVRFTKAFYPYLLQQNRGHIVNLSSVFGLVGIGLQVHYCSSKFAVRGFTESLRMELHNTPICTLTVLPGGVKTNIARNTPITKANVPPNTKEEAIATFETIARTTADSAAQQIIAAIVTGKERLVIGSDGKMLDFLARCFPSRYTALLYHQIKKFFKDLP